MAVDCSNGWYIEFGLLIGLGVSLALWWLSIIARWMFGRDPGFTEFHRPHAYLEDWPPGGCQCGKGPAEPIHLREERRGR